MTEYAFNQFINDNILANCTILVEDILLPFHSFKIINCTGKYNEYGKFEGAMQYYFVSPMLYNQLKFKNEPVTEFKNLHIWGRMGCGFALKYEQVLIDIYNNPIG